MDPNRFDRISRRLARKSSRRGSLASAGRFGAVAALSGFVQQRVALAQQADSICELEIGAGIRVGPSSERGFGEAEPGLLRGTLRIPLSDSGRLTDVELTLSDGAIIGGSGQITGQAVTLRFDIPLTGTIILVGAGEQSLKSCEGKLDGLLTGPSHGDIGDWHATVTNRETTEIPLDEATSTQDSVGDEVDSSAGEPVATEAPVAVCVEDFGACSTDDECCHHICFETCQPCIDFDGDCDELKECCGTLICTQGNCRRELGDSCTSSLDCASGVCINDICTVDPEFDCIPPLEPCDDQIRCCFGECVTEGSQRICGLV